MPAGYFKTTHKEKTTNNTCCGAGGTTSGFEEAEIHGQRIAKVVACVNHDRDAIISHKYNNPWARQDKAPISIVNVEAGEILIPIYEDDSEFTVKIKEFMTAHGIVDIKMRMLKIPELLKIQGFRENYRLHGTKAQQKKYIGNAVVPLVVKRWAEAIGKQLLIQQQNVA